MWHTGDAMTEEYDPVLVTYPGGMGRWFPDRDVGPCGSDIIGHDGLPQRLRQSSKRVGPMRGLVSG